jgi:serine O-acetyltransferase
MIKEINAWQRFKEDIKCVFDRDPAARTTFEVVTTYPGLHAIQWHRLSHYLWKHEIKWFARFLSMFSRWLTDGFLSIMAWAL